jgi:hypothetical protein
VFKLYRILRQCLAVFGHGIFHIRGVSHAPHLPISVRTRKQGLPQKSLAKAIEIYPRYPADIKNVMT